MSDKSQAWLHDEEGGAAGSVEYTAGESRPDGFLVDGVPYVHHQRSNTYRRMNLVSGKLVPAPQPEVKAADDEPEPQAEAKAVKKD